MKLSWWEVRSTAQRYDERRIGSFFHFDFDPSSPAESGQRVYMERRAMIILGM
ncbi:hypothetical protein M413DRAFT_450018 [Hebeloma cylindrosporum]|uniref:Uncharacterized protein n=1 Tax=Hebeloma cylindrosporum TaxID=76867 RepID=A0A0C2Y190_HEBCY|nr:hypothetical protein M413DRAFT_450018 [Hebeloma cylindrosporum h7]